MHTSVIRGALVALVLVALVPMVSAMTYSGSSTASDGVSDFDEDVKWMHNLYTPDAVLTGSTGVWTYIDLEIYHWGTEPTAGGSTGGTHSGTQLPAYVRAENDGASVQPVLAGWSFYASGSGGSRVNNASINCSYKVELKKLVVNKNGSATTYNELSAYADTLAGNSDLPRVTPPSDGDDLDYDIPAGEFYQLTATGKVSGSWSGANGNPGPTHHKLVAAHTSQTGVYVEGCIEIDIYEE